MHVFTSNGGFYQKFFLRLCSENSGVVFVRSSYSAHYLYFVLDIKMYLYPPPPRSYTTLPLMFLCGQVAGGRSATIVQRIKRKENLKNFVDAYTKFVPKLWSCTRKLLACHPIVRLSDETVVLVCGLRENSDKISPHRHVVSFLPACAKTQSSFS